VARAAREKTGPETPEALVVEMRSEFDRITREAYKRGYAACLADMAKEREETTSPLTVNLNDMEDMREKLPLMSTEQLADVMQMDSTPAEPIKLETIQNEPAPARQKKSKATA
jgi:hypothetical protein